MSSKLCVEVMKMYDDVKIPEYKTEGSAGCDVRTYLYDQEEKKIIKRTVIADGETQLLGTGLKFSVPKGYFLAIFPRSGIALKTKMRIANSVGVLDSDFRGELMIIAENISNNPIIIEHDERIAQLLFIPVSQAIFLERQDLDETVRAEGGFGSTGKH